MCECVRACVSCKRIIFVWNLEDDLVITAMRLPRNFKYFMYKGFFFVNLSFCLTCGEWQKK